MLKKIKNFIKNDDNKIKLGNEIITVGLGLSLVVAAAGITMIATA